MNNVFIVIREVHKQWSDVYIDSIIATYSDEIKAHNRCEQEKTELEASRYRWIDAYKPKTDPNQDEEYNVGDGFVNCEGFTPQQVSEMISSKEECFFGNEVKFKVFKQELL